MLRRVAFALIVACMVAGCASAPRALPDVAPGSAVAPGAARITVTRSSGLLYLALPADVTINDQAAGALMRGETTLADVPAGQTSIAVSGFGMPGRFLLRFPTVPGGRYGLQVAPRGEAVMPNMMLGMVGSMLDAAANPERGGAFVLSVVSAEPPIGAPAPLASPGVLSSPAEREERLGELRRLRARGLISDDVYREEQRRVLAPMAGGAPP